MIAHLFAIAISTRQSFQDWIGLCYGVEGLDTHFAIHLVIGLVQTMERLCHGILARASFYLHQEQINFIKEDNLQHKRFQNPRINPGIS